MRMNEIIIKSHYYYWNSKLTPNFCNSVKNYIDDLPLEESLVGSSLDYSVNKDVRRTQVKLWAIDNEEDSFQRIISLEMYRLAIEANQHFNFDVDFNSIVIQLGKYLADDKGYFNWHEDDSVLFRGHDRKLTLAGILQPAKVGGQFEIEGGAEGVEQVAGTVISFPSYLKHQVTPVEKGDRYSVVCWISGPEWK